MFRKKDAVLEIEADGDVKSGAPPGDPRGMVRSPKWMRIVHFSLHALSALLIAILVIVMVCVELDAKDGGDDGAANAFLKPVGLNLDGGATLCERRVEAADGTAAGDASTSGYVAAAVAFMDVVESWAVPVDAWDTFVSPDARFLSRDGTSRTLQEEKDYATRRRAAFFARNNGTDAAMFTHEVTGFAMGDPNSVITQSHIKRGGEVVSSFFSVSVFDPQTGLIVRQLFYPNMSTDLLRVANVQRMLGAFTFMYQPVTDDEFEATLKMLDGVLTDDFEFVQGNYYTFSGKRAFKQMLRGLYESTKASPPKAHAMHFVNEIFSGGSGSSQHVIDRYLLYDGPDENSQMVSAGYSDYRCGAALPAAARLHPPRSTRVADDPRATRSTSFGDWPKDYSKIRRMEDFEMEYLSKRGEAALLFPNIMNETVAMSTEEEKRASVERVRELLADDWSSMLETGSIYDFDDVSWWFSKGVTEKPSRQQYQEEWVISNTYTEIEFMDAVYVFWKDASGGSPFAIHHFVPGTTIISSSFFAPKEMWQRDGDGNLIDTRGLEMQRTRDFLASTDPDAFRSNALADRQALVTDDFIADTYFGGVQTLEEMAVGAKTDLRAHFDNEETRETLASFLTGHTVVNHGVWKKADGSVANTVLDIFEFENVHSAEGAADRRIQSFTLYKSTDVMNEEP